MYKLSVTTIEKFRRYLAEVSSFDTEEAVIAAIKGTFEGTDKTRFGSAYHKIIEGEYSPMKNGFVKAGGYVFTSEQAAPALAYRAEHQNVFNEIKTTMVYDVPGYERVTIVCKVDVMEGLHLRDAKCKFRSPDWKEYSESVQWKFYLDMLDAKSFFYDVFEVKGFEGFVRGSAIASDVQIVAHDPVEYRAYPGMHDELRSLLSDMFAFIDSRKLYQFLKPADDIPSILDS